ncbi:phytoene/squalene synthase family protein [Mycobacterium sp. BMJ-28]
MINDELNAAGVRGTALRDAYAHCRSINARDGKTFFLATRLLAPQQRPAVHALYGFARYADDILDTFDERDNLARAAELQSLSDRLFGCLTGAASPTGDPVLTAVVHTARQYDLGWGLFDDFLASMRMDLTVTGYPNRPALERYMYGSAEVIGLQMLPVLGTTAPREEAEPRAAALGKAFQLTNFLRDVDEDLTRGRVYLPADELAGHGVDRDVLLWCQRNGRIDQRVRNALIEQHAATRRVYREAEPGIAMLAPQSRPCVQAAFTLYSEILSCIEDSDYQVFGRRASVGNARRAVVAGRGLIGAWWARAQPRRR